VCSRSFRDAEAEPLVMPELPEVETVVRGLRTVLPGRTITAVRLGKTDFIDNPTALAESLPGSRIVSASRLGKFIRLELEAGERPGAHPERRQFVVHLGMTGRLLVCSPDEPCAKHTHAWFELDDGRELRYVDPRRFGRMLLVNDSVIAVLASRLGQDPLEISRAEFARLFSRRRATIKSLLLDQRLLRGVGNIYADESLWLARLHPARPGGSLHAGELARLFRALRIVLRSAIRWRGSSIVNYVDERGEPGGYQHRHRVYQREGKPCARCGARVRRMVIIGRSAHFCPRCQRLRLGQRRVGAGHRG
jgi:formamidopyrimidine-DNA glycosylase